jgi:signal transduction histidine kinase
MRHLDRLRLHLTWWYVGTFAAILIVFGASLFFAIAHSVGVKLDRSLGRASSELARVAATNGANSHSAAVGSTPTVRELRIPDRMLYLFDTRGRVVQPETASVWVKTAARDALRRGSASLGADIGHEHTLRVHATRFVNASGDTMVAVAAADTEELEDEFWNLITLFAGSVAAALVAVALGGYLLAWKSTAPVEASFEQMRRFMADAAHELRTPVSFLRAHSDVALQRPRSAAEYEQALREISSEADHLGKVVNDLFTLARAESGERTVAHERFFLDDVALEAATEVRTAATLRGVHVDVTDFEETPVEGDAGLTRQLLTIVLDNAIKYTGAGGRVTIGVRGEDTRGTLVIEDTGIGIPEAALPNVFDRFYRAESARQHADGAGLGLSIARWIADAQHADLRISSKAGCGTRVQLSFPSTN